MHGLISTAAHGGEVKRTGNRSGASAVLWLWWRWWREACWIVGVSAEPCSALSICRLQSSASEERGQAILKHGLSREHSVAWCLLFTTSSLGPSLLMAEWESTSKQILLLLSTLWTWGEITLLCSLKPPLWVPWFFQILYNQASSHTRLPLPNCLLTFQGCFHSQNIYCRILCKEFSI